MGDEQAGDKRVAKKRGRRPRAGVAMTGAERQAAYRNRRRQSFIRLELDHGDFAGLIEIVREVAARPSTGVIATQEELNAHMAKLLLPRFESRYAKAVAARKRELGGRPEEDGIDEDFRCCEYAEYPEGYDDEEDYDEDASPVDEHVPG